MTMQLHLQQVPASNGRVWIRHGFKIFQRQPLAFLGLMGLALLASLVLSALPFVGPVQPGNHQNDVCTIWLPNGCPYAHQSFPHNYCIG